MGNGKKMAWLLLMGLVFYFGVTFSALAHKVTVFAWVDGKTVYTESKFSGGKRVKEGEIRVYDENKALLLKGVTNDQGEFSFPLPKTPPLVVELNAGMGHLARWTLTPEDVEGGEAQSGEDDAGKKGDVSTVSDVPDPHPDLQAEKNKELSAMIEQSVEQAVDKKLKPMMKLLVDMHEQKTSFSDVFGGIGYILGLVGLVAYFKAKRS